MDPAEITRYWEANAERWTAQARAGYDVYRDALNTPAFLAMLPEVKGLKGLDIGCGEGANTRAVAGLGAAMAAVDLAPTFIRLAKEEEAARPLGIDYRLGDALALPFEDESFDFATAFMVLMDLADQGGAIKEAARVVRPGGFFQFSVLHPCFVPPKRKVHRTAVGRIRGIEVAGYFDAMEGEIDRWWFSALPEAERGRVPAFEIPRYHRTLGQWIDFVVASGLQLEKLGEPMADEATAAAEPAVADTRVAPLFMHMRLRKPG